MDARNTEVLRDVVVIGGSQGAMEALRILLTRLPADFPAAVLIVIHTNLSEIGRASCRERVF